MIEDLAWLKARHPWPRLETVIVVDSTGTACAGSWIRKDSFRLRRKVSAWDDDFLASLLAA